MRLRCAAGMTQIKMSKEDMNNLEFVERRRLSLERYLRHTATHPVLRMDPDLREFLELERELPHASQTSALSSSSVLKMFSRTVESLGKLTFHMPETDMVRSCFPSSLLSLPTIRTR